MSWFPEYTIESAPAGSRRFMVATRDHLGYLPAATARWGPRVGTWRSSFRLDDEHWRVRRPDTGSGASPGWLGLAVLSRVPVRGHEVIPLVRLRRDAAQRMVIGCDLELEGGELAVFGSPPAVMSGGVDLERPGLQDLRRQSHEMH